MKKLKSIKISTGTKLFCIALPFIVFTFAFSYVPLFGWFYALSDYKMGMLWYDASYIGFTHFEKFFRHNAEVIRVLRNTMALSGLWLLTTPLPVLFAILLNEVRVKRYKSLVQTITTLPNFISWIIVFGMAFALFSMNGLINTIFGQLGLPRSTTGIIGDKDNVWAFQTALAVWKSLGWNTIIYLAAISGIDPQLYEAAKVDGASRSRCIWHITIPGIFNTYFVLFILAISNILNTGFEQYFVFYNPLVANKIEVLDFYVYRVGIKLGDYPFSIAVGMMKSLIGISLLFIVNQASKKVRGDPIF